MVHKLCISNEMPLCQGKKPTAERFCSRPPRPKLHPVEQVMHMKGQRSRAGLNSPVRLHVNGVPTQDPESHASVVFPFAVS